MISEREEIQYYPGRLISFVSCKPFYIEHWTESTMKLPSGWYKIDQDHVPLDYLIFEGVEYSLEERVRNVAKVTIHPLGRKLEINVQEYDHAKSLLNDPDDLEKYVQSLKKSEA